MAVMLTSNAQFRPFSYDEIVKPLVQETQAQQDIENQYGDLSMQANVWKGLANQQSDPKAYATYSNYADQLNQSRDALLNNGLNDSSRNALMNMKSQYASDIVPIKNAYERRQTLADEQRKMLEQNPTLMFSKNASNMSLDDLIANPAASYNSTSGALITQQVATAANALAKEIQSDPSNAKYRSILGNSYYELARQQGFSSKAVMQAIANSPNASPILKGIVEKAVNSSGIKNWGDNDSINRAYDYAKQGLWNAVGTTQYQTLENWRAKMAAEEAMQERLMAEKEAAKQSKDSSLPAYKPKSVSDLSINGDPSAYVKALNELHAGSGFKSSVFGNHFQYNPMKVYEEYQKILNPTLSNASSFVHMSRTSSAIPNINTSKALAAFKAKYPGIQVISDNTYKALKNLGYNSSLNGSALKGNISDIDNRVNAQSKRYTEYDINGDIKQAAKDLYSNMEDISLNKNNFSGIVQPLDQDFKPTSDKFKYSNIDTKKNPIKYIRHSMAYPDKLIIGIAGKGRYLVDPSLFSNEVGNIVKGGAYMINKYGSNSSHAQLIESALMDKLKSAFLYGSNKHQSSTFSKEPTESIGEALNADEQNSEE